MSVSLELKAAIRNLLLPVTKEQEEEYLEYVQLFLVGLGVDEVDQSHWLNYQLRLWRKTGAPSKDLTELVKDVLYNQDRDTMSFAFQVVDKVYSEAARRLSEKYFDIHTALRDNWLFPHDDARQLLSHAGMLVRLRIMEGMTSSELSRVLASKDIRFDLNWKAIREILRPLGLQASLDIDSISTIYKMDVEAEPCLFADLDLRGAIDKVSVSAKNLGCPGDFNKWLNDLVFTGYHPPFLVMLHYQLSTLSAFDHAVSYAYEFAPRGQACLWLTEKYKESGIDVKKTTFLNNAKATLRLDFRWAIDRDNYIAAKALTHILIQFETLSPLAKRELADHIRAFLVRFLRLKKAELEGQVVPNELKAMNSAQIKSLVLGVGKGNTGTGGIIEQRLVDCFALALHEGENQWKAKGLGDSVYAANVPCKKLGDVELLDVEDQHIEAYEAHGGTLKEFYLQDHLDSFGQILGLRKADLEAIEPLDRWDIEVHYVAHASELHEGYPKKLEVDIEGCNSITVDFSQTLFKNLWLSAFKDYEHLERLFLNNFVAPLNSPNVSASARAKVKELAGIV